MRKTQCAVSRWSVLVMGVLLVVQDTHGQSSNPPPHDTDLDLSGPAKSNAQFDWTADWTSQETDAMNEYMGAHAGMREWIQQSGRSFHLGTVYGTAVAKRLCDLMAVGEDWDCEDNETNHACYCNNDPACDPRLVTGPPYPDSSACRANTGSLTPSPPILDYDAFKALSAYEFNQCGMSGMSPQVTARRKDPGEIQGLYSFFLQDEAIADVGQANGQVCTGHNVIWQIPPWMAHTVSTPLEMASVLIEHIDTVIGHYTSMNPNPISRWVLANEVVHSNAPAVALDGVVSAGATSWTVAIGTSPDPLGAIPLPTVTIAGETINGSEPGGKVIEVFALVDDEIVKITSRTGNSLSVVRGQAGTTATTHDDGALLYTIKGLIQCVRNDFWPGVETNANFRPKYWLWRTVSDYDNGRANDISDFFLIDCYQRAHEADSNALLFYNDYGCTFAPMYGATNPRFKNVLALVRLLIASGAPLHGVGFQTHLPVWSCLTHDSNGENGLRLNPKQLRGIVESLTTFAQYVPNIILSELDLRMGIPINQVPPNGEYTAMDNHVDDVWENANITIRQKWQGYVYKAVVDAALAVAKVNGITFWGTVDKHCWLNVLDPNGWPWYPTYPDPSACNADIIGAAVNTGTNPPSMYGHYYLKPAYHEVRKGIADYFGAAFSVKDASGNELVRFVNNGNVIVLKGPLHENHMSWDGIGLFNSFIVKNSAGDKKAVVDPNGEMFLVGEVDDEIANLSMPESGKAFIVKNHNGDVVSLIDDQGDLKARGKVIVNGVPYKLEKAHGDGSNDPDPYSTYE